MSKQLSPEERFALVQRVHSATYQGNPNRVSVEQACRDVGIAPSNYHRWKKLLNEKSDWVAQRQIPIQSTAPKRNGMSLPDHMRTRMAEIARSGLYKNPRQIAKALESEGIQVSDNAVRNNLEKAGLYGLKIITGSNGELIKKKVILPPQPKG